MPTPDADIDEPALARRSRGRPPLSASDVAARRARIVDVAARMFFDAGFEHTHIEAIGREAGVTKRTIYELVGDKQAVFLAASTKMHAEGPHFRFDVPVTGRTAREVLADMAGQLIAHTIHPEMIAIERTILAEARRLPHIARRAVVDGKANLDHAIARIFDRLIEAGELPPVDTLAAACIFYDAAIGARGFRAIFGHPPEPATPEDIATRVDMFLTGYVARHTCARQRRAEGAVGS